MSSEIEQLKTRLGTCSDERGRPTDGGLTLENPTAIDPEAKAAHLWKLGKLFVLDVVLQDGQVKSKELSTKDGEPKTRGILTDGEPRPGVIRQKLTKTGLQGKEMWTTVVGGGSYFDLTAEENDAIEKHGAPVIVYSNGDVELIEPDPRHSDNLDY
jgi:hypothetical protein